MEEVKQQVKEIMSTYHQHISSNELDNNWYCFVSKINKLDNPYEQYFVQFHEQFSRLSEDDLKNIFKYFRTKIPTIFYEDIVKQFRNYQKIHNDVRPRCVKDFTPNIIVKLLAYTTLVEVVVRNYETRIDTLFGW